MRAKFVIEGVGDKYLFNKYNMKDEDVEFEKTYQSYQAQQKLIHIGSFLDEIDEKTYVYKNPKKLTN